MISRGRCVPRVPRPKSFLGVISLQTSTELIAITLLINKATGFYGFLTLLTGFVPSALQVTWYTLSLAIIGALAYLIPHIRKQSPFQNLALAYLYVVDTLLHFGYVSAFAMSWYLQTLKRGQGEGDGEEDGGGGIERRQDGLGDYDAGDEVVIEGGEGNPDAAFSMVLVVLFTVVRIYFSLIIMSYARSVLQRYSYVNEERGTAVEDIVADGSSPNPFVEGASQGEGWKGKVGRFLVSIGQGYWLGRSEEDEEWARTAGAKFRRGRRGGDRERV